MPINYFITKGINPRNPEEGTKYQGRFRQKSRVDVDEIAKSISDQSSASPSDVEATIRTLFEVIAERASEGFIVRMGRLGSFRMTLKSSLVSEEKYFKKSMIRGANIIFNPGSLLQNALAGAEYKSNK